MCGKVLVGLIYIDTYAGLGAENGLKRNIEHYISGEFNIQDGVVFILKTEPVVI